METQSNMASSLHLKLVIPVLGNILSHGPGLTGDVCHRTGIGLHTWVCSKGVWVRQWVSDDILQSDGLTSDMCLSLAELWLRPCLSILSWIKAKRRGLCEMVSHCYKDMTSKRMAGDLGSDISLFALAFLIILTCGEDCQDTQFENHR